MKVVSTIRERTERRGAFFTKAVMAAAMAKVNHGHAEDFLQRDDAVTPLVLTRAAIEPGTTTTSGWAAEVARDAFRAFLGDLAPYSGAARLIAKAVPAAVGGVAEAKYPVRVGAPTAPAWCGEGGAIPVRSNQFTAVTVGPARKMAHMLVWSRELGKRSDAEAIFDKMLREDVAAGLDAAFFATSAGTASAHAGLLNGVTAIAGYAGGDEEALKRDFLGLAEAVATGGSGDVTFVMAPERLARLRVQAPQLAAAMDIAPSAAVPADRVIAADAAALLVSVDPAPEILTAEEGTIHMSDVPLEIVSDSPATADPVRSLFQTASTAARVLHDLAFAKRRSGAVAYVDGATW